MKLSMFRKNVVKAFIGAAALCATAVSAQTLTSNSTGTNNGFYYSFWKDSGSASMTLYGAGRYSSQWTNNTNNWVGGKGWQPGNSSRTISYSGYYGGSNSQNTYLAVYGWTRSPLVEYYVIESYGSYNPATCNGGTDYGSFQSDGATYNVRRCQRVNQPSIDSNTSTFYQYFSVRNPKKGFGNISGTVTFANHAAFWASKGLNLGQHDYQIVATEGYQSSGNSDLTVSQGAISSSAASSSAANSSTATSTGTSTGTSSGITVRARGVAGSEHIYLKVGGANVASWTLTTSYQNYVYSGAATGDIQIQYDNDTTGLDVQVDYIQANGEIRQAEDMTYNTAAYINGSCGGGGNSEMMHCNGVIGFGTTSDCFSGSCGGTASSAASNAASSTGNNSCAGYVGITFDDGPNGNTTTLINLLKQNGLTPVTWFNQGNNVTSNSSLVGQERSVGEVQNHSYSHSHMTSWSYSQVLDELTRTNQAIQNAGAPKPTLFRPPYGETNSTINQAASAAGLKVVTWDVDSQDWNGASASAIANANNQLQNGQIILMHDGSYTNTNAAISQIAANLRAKGLCPGRIDPSTGRAVAPYSSSSSAASSVIVRSSSSVAPSSSSIAASSIASSAAVSSVASSVASSSGNGQCSCNWYGTVYPSCVTTTSGWGWENNKSCISNSTCTTQPSNQGGLVCGGVSSSAPRSSSSAPSSSSSSSSLISSSVSSSLVSSSRSSSSSSSSSNGTLVYAVDAGATSSSTINGIVYQADRYASGGTTQTVTNAIAGTTNDALYQSERYGSYSYEIPVSNATYSVVLNFAELYQTASGGRSFSVSVEGKSVLSSFDLFSTAGGFTAYDQRVDGIAVTDGKLTITLTTVVDNATIAGFAIYSSDGGTFTGGSEPECSTSDRQIPTSISYDRAVTRSEQKNPPSGAFGYAIEHATQTLPNHTIYRPDLSRANNIPIVVWGNGACSNVGTEQADFLLQIASNGYLVIANGGPFGSGTNDQHETELVKAIDWAVKENSRTCSQYYGKLNVKKIATMGWSCGGGMAHFAAVDSRVTTAVALNSGLGIYGDRSSYYPRFHTPVAIFNGDSRDVAYNPGLQEYSEVNNVPFYHANYPQGHGDAYYQDNGGEFGIVATGWLNYMLKDDQSSSGKGMFFGSNCRLCKSPWVMKNKGF
ncbi:MAG: hypothetical protein EOO52_17820 [Gammaproteobacteria bacterium]|nr:MAG: hypothetical protein EOO52_17820 [Gammaproteobacteria bacterium]